MNMAIGRMQVSVRVVEPARPHTREVKQTASTDTASNARHAYERNRLHNEVEADRRRWSDSMLLSGPQRR